MTRKVVFLPGMKEERALRRLRASVIQFRRLLAAWLFDIEGIRVIKDWQRDFWQPPVEVLKGLPHGKPWQVVGAAIHIGANTSALGFLSQLGDWVASIPNIRLADSRFGYLPSDSGDTLTVVFLVLEECGSLRMRPVCRGSRPRPVIRVSHQLQLGQKETADEPVV